MADIIYPRGAKDPEFGTYVTGVEGPAGLDPNMGLSKKIFLLVQQKV